MHHEQLLSSFHKSAGTCPMLPALALRAFVRCRVKLPAQDLHPGLSRAEPCVSPSASQAASPSSVAGLTATRAAAFVPEMSWGSYGAPSSVSSGCSMTCKPAVPQRMAAPPEMHLDLLETQAAQARHQSRRHGLPSICPAWCVAELSMTEGPTLHPRTGSMVTSVPASLANQMSGSSPGRAAPTMLMAP